MTLSAIILATIAGGMLSVLAASLLSVSILGKYAPRLVSFSVGVLLAVAFLDLIPEASESLAAEQVGATILGGLLLFFLLEKMALWRHDHSSHGHADQHAPAAMMILLGDGMHNFVDGILIAAAFLQDWNLGLATAAAVIAHEIPQEVGDFMVLLACGYSRSRALLLNLASGSTAVVGGVIGYFALEQASVAIPHVLCIAAASFIYVAVADMVPVLQRDRKPTDAVLQTVLLIIGLVVVVVLHAH